MASRGKPPPPDWDIVVECFREAEFLWGRWEHALDSHRHTLDDVDHWVEERLLGAIDGTVVGGARAIDELLVPALAAKRPREASAAAFALACAGPSGFEPLMRALAELPAAKLDAVARGMELTRDRGDPMRWWSRVPRLPPAGQAAMLRIYAYRQLPAPPETDQMIDRGASEVQLACLQLAATTRAAWAHPYIEWGLRRSSPALRAAAAWAGMIQGVKDAKAVAAELARTASACCRSCRRGCSKARRPARCSTRWWRWEPWKRETCARAHWPTRRVLGSRPMPCARSRGSLRMHPSCGSPTMRTSCRRVRTRLCPSPTPTRWSGVGSDCARRSPRGGAISVGSRSASTRSAAHWNACRPAAVTCSPPSSRCARAGSPASAPRPGPRCNAPSSRRSPCPCPLRPPAVFPRIWCDERCCSSTTRLRSRPR
jgi:hypothetical protein